MDFKTAAYLMLICFLGVAAQGCDVNNCTLLSELECALYTTDSNVLRLNQAFFPPRKATSRFIRVIYGFVDDNCTVDFFWAIGGFLLIQPPRIYELTSLFFSYPANSLENLTITLPQVCKHLVGEDSCSCIDTQNNNLDIFTQQVRIIIIPLVFSYCYVYCT